MIDSAAIPVLFALVVIFLAYIGISWTGRRENRAIVIRDEDEDDPAEFHGPR